MFLTYSIVLHQRTPIGSRQYSGSTSPLPSGPLPSAYRAKRDEYLLWCVMLTLSEMDCKSFLRLYQNCHMQKRKRGGTGISFTPLYPPLAQILPQNRFPVNPWFTMNHGVQADLCCSLPAVYRSCAFHIGPRYPAHKCLMPMASLLILLSGNVSHCVPLCRVLLTALRVCPFSKNKTGFGGFLRKSISLRNAEQNVLCHLNLRGEPWGRKLCRLKCRGRKASPTRLTSARNAG